MPELCTTTFSIHPFSKSEAGYEAIAAVATAVWPETPSMASQIERRDLETPDHILNGRLVAELGGEVVGYCNYGQIERIPDPGIRFIFACVQPDRQRCGIGTALYEAALDQLRSNDLQEIRTHAREDDIGAMRFVETRGFEVLQREPISYLDLRTAEPEGSGRALDQQIDICTLRQLQTTTPDWQRKCWALETEINQDIPIVGPRMRRPFSRYARIFDQPYFTPEAWFIALDGSDWIGMSTIWPYEPTLETYYTGITGVRRPYRRQGIAHKMKLHAIEYVRSAGGRRIHTENEENNPMLSLNKKLGFVPGPAWLLMKAQV